MQCFVKQSIRLKAFVRKKNYNQVLTCVRNFDSLEIIQVNEKNLKSLKLLISCGGTLVSATLATFLGDIDIHTAVAPRYGTVTK